MNSQFYRRALGGLQGVAVGDVLGVPAVHYSRDELLRTYGGPITDITRPVPHSGRRKWDMAEVTDDTVLTALLAASIIEDQGVDRISFATRLLQVDSRYCKPGTQCGTFKANGSPYYVAADGLGNGAAIRVSPVGIITPLPDQDRLVAEVIAISSLTHGSRQAIGGAVAIAAAVSAATEGLDVRAVIEFALDTLRRYERTWDHDGLTRSSSAILEAMATGPEETVRSFGDTGEWGFRAEESIPVVFATLALDEEPVPALLHCVNLGGDADSIASMVGAISGAIYPEAIPLEWVQVVEERNALDLEALAKGLAAIRRRRSGEVGRGERLSRYGGQEL